MMLVHHQLHWRVTRQPLLFCHLADHVIQDAAMVEVGELHVSVEPHPSLEHLSVVQLQTAP